MPLAQAPPADTNGADTEPDAEEGVAGCKILKNDSEFSQIEMVKIAVQFKNRQIFEWGQKAKVLESCLAQLNGLDILRLGHSRIVGERHCCREGIRRHHE